MEPDENITRENRSPPKYNRLVRYGVYVAIAALLYAVFCGTRCDKPEQSERQQGKNIESTIKD